MVKPSYPWIIGKECPRFHSPHISFVLKWNWAALSVVFFLTFFFLTQRYSFVQKGHVSSVGKTFPASNPPNYSCSFVSAQIWTDTTLCFITQLLEGTTLSRLSASVTEIGGTQISSYCSDFPDMTYRIWQLLILFIFNWSIKLNIFTEWYNTCIHCIIRNNVLIELNISASSNIYLFGKNIQNPPL